MTGEGEKRTVDISQVKTMFDRALAAGITYFDTAYPYHGGQSETIVGEHLCREHRDEFLLATKMPVWKVKEHADFDRIFNEQLEKLQTDHIDFYLIHAIGYERWTQACDLGIREWLIEKQKSGAIRYKGFSFHGPEKEFPLIIDEWADQWDFCQIQYNFVDTHNQAGTRGLHYAASLGIGVVIMEPLLGGNLVSPPPEVNRIWAEAGGRDAVELALDWLWDQNEVGTVLSGMSSLEQLEQNIEYAGRSGVGMLSDEVRELFPRAKKTYQKIRPIACTSCEYCLPCPSGVAIPRVFAAANDAVAFRQPAGVRARYGGVAEENRAGACVECGECLEKCPQSIDIINDLKKAHELLTA
jgi:predicted aldo/keto reductase-like oxidoreductase